MRLVAVICLFIPLVAQSASKVSEKELKSALDVLASKTFMKCINSPNQQAVKLSRIVNIDQSCAENRCEVDTVFDIQFLAGIEKVNGSNCGFDIGYYWNNPGFTAYLVKGRPGYWKDDDMVKAGEYATGKELRLQKKMFFKKFDSGWKIDENPVVQLPR